VRSLAHGMGYRFRLHRNELPGKPDLVFPGLRKVLFVHGCFWHGHACVRGRRVPVHNRDYWTAKVARNKERDKRVRRALKAQGWSSFAIWECELKGDVAVKEILKNFLGPRQGIGVPDRVLKVRVSSNN
jgi:DNA mismatch endonuclease, patch repair protein